MNQLRRWQEQESGQIRRQVPTPAALLCLPAWLHGSSHRQPPTHAPHSRPTPTHCPPSPHAPLTRWGTPRRGG